MNNSSEKGFTLVELTIVVVIMAILVVIVIPFFKEGYNTSKEKTDLLNLKTLNTATDLFKMSDESDSITFDEDITGSELMELLVEKGYLEQTFAPVYEGANFNWDNDHDRWTYQKPPE